MKHRILLALSLCLAITGCSDWLNVSSDSTTTAQKQFSSESGFRDALIGVYLKLGSTSLYGANLSWRNMEEVAQTYTYYASHTDKDAWSINQNSTVLEDCGSGAWDGLYNAIANINNLLIYEEKNRDLLPAVEDSIIRGEALALRAYCHLDLIRMFGKGNLAGRPELLQQKTIPYQKTFSKILPEQITYREYMDNIYADLDEAIEYLKADPQYAQYDRPDGYYDAVEHDGFISINESERRIRMNTFAAEGLYARALMWEGTSQARAKAKTFAQKAVGEILENSNQKWWWSTQSWGITTASWISRSGLLYQNECLWLLYFDFLSVQQTGYQSQWFNGTKNAKTVNIPSTYADEVYEVNEGILSDYRYTYGLDNVEGTELSLLKFRMTDPNGNQRSIAYGNRMPMLRISEQYYILAECAAEEGDLEAAVNYLNIVRQSRNVPALSTADLTKAAVDNEIFKEYRKELIGEGQMFYYYKRKGFTSITGANGVVSDLSDAQYVFPMPTSETQNGLIQY